VYEQSLSAMRQNLK